MILIISKEKLDPSTDDIIEWLISWDINFTKLHGENLYPAYNNSVYIDFNLNQVIIGNIDINQHFKYGWFRRWSDRGHISELASHNFSNSTFRNLTNVLDYDEISLREYFYDHISVDNWVSEPKTASINKLQVLRYANSIDLKIPESILCNDKQSLIKFIDKYEKVITKDISIPFSLFGKKKKRLSYAIELTESVLNGIPEKFNPSLFQKYIDKKFEIRSFYFNRRFYSMAIFSQNDDKTKIDFRNYNYDKPNRRVPYQLPIEIENKLTQLMDKFSLDTGSIDLIKDWDNNFIFLEVNPVGQFGMTSHPCNYKLEKLIAQKITSSSK